MTTNTTRQQQRQPQQQQQQHQQLPHYVNLFFQHTDDVILRILEFLECQSLIRTSLTCSRFKQLAHRSATQRTYHIAQARQLNNVMQLLRAKEQLLDGVAHGIHDRHVPVPMLLLGRRVLVTNAGDPEYNGVYYCTNSNGNGFVFTKPRFPIQRVSAGSTQQRLETGGHPNAASHARHRLQNMDLDEEDNNGGHNHNVRGIPVRGDRLQQRHHHHHQHHRPPQIGMNPANNNDINNVHLFMQQPPGAAIPPNEGLSSRSEGEDAQPGQPLRCIISKRFSNETILWYMSKEVEMTRSEAVQLGRTAAEEEDDESEVVVREVFAFWAKLMVLGAASPDECKYPSQSSVLARQSEGWQSLSTAHRAPTVELLD
jgi:hypothetical protein